MALVEDLLASRWLNDTAWLVNEQAPVDESIATTSLNDGLATIKPAFDNATAEEKVDFLVQLLS